MSKLQEELALDKHIQRMEDAVWMPLKLQILNEIICDRISTDSTFQSKHLISELSPYFYSMLPGLVEEENLSRSPEILKRLIDLFPSDDALTHMYQQAFALLCRTYMRLNEFHKTVLILEKSGWLKNVPIPEFLIKPGRFDRKHLDDTVSWISTNLADDKKEYLQLIEPKKLQNSSSRLKALFVLSDGTSSTGLISETYVARFEIRKGLQVDQVRISSHLVDEDDALADQAKALCSYLRTIRDIKPDYGLRIEFAIDQPTTILGGNSIGLAMGLLSQIAHIGYRKNHAFEHQVYGDIAFTGALSSDGYIEPVDDEGLKQKLEAAFYGPVTAVVVPSSQIDICREQLSNLIIKYPYRELKIIPADHLDSVYHHREVINVQRRKVLNRAGQFVKDNANSVTLIILGFIVICFLGFYFGVVKYPVPNEITSDGYKFKIKNKYGYKLWETPILTEKLAEVENRRNWIDRMAKIIDLDNDGTREIVIGFGNRNPIPNILRGQVVCYGSKGNILWSEDSGEEVKYGDDVYPNNFHVSKLIVNDLNNDGKPEIICKADHSYFPTRILVLDNGGEYLADYWHSGSLKNMIISEIYPDNNTKEILLTGVNNEKNQGVFIVLDPFKMSGSSPQQDVNYQNQDYDNGNEIFYIRFPSTSFKNYFSKNQPGDGATIVSITEDNLFQIFLSNNISQLINSKFIGVVIYYFDSNAEVKFADLNDGYYPLYSEVFPDREKLPNGAPELINHFRAVDYWNGYKWVKEPTINKRYLESIKLQID